MSLNQDVPRDLLRRIADDLPYVDVTGDTCELRAAHEIYASLVADALGVGASGARTSSHENFRTALAVPGWWTPRAVERVAQALAARNVNVLLVNDAEAAVVEYQHSTHPLPQNVAVVSLRANEVSAVIVSTCDSQPTALASPILVHDEGGDELDFAVLQHLINGLTELGHTVDAADPGVIASARTAVDGCRTLREKLSLSATESLLPELPDVTQRLRLVRSELEEIATPWADAVVGIVNSVVEQSPFEVDGVLLTGGLAHMPLVSQRISADLGVEVYVPEDPRMVVVRGAERILNVQPALEAEATPAGVVAHQDNIPFWQVLKNRVSQWSAPPQSAAPKSAAAEAPGHEIETLLDPISTSKPQSGVDMSWIPSRPKGESLVQHP
ncbi:MAG: Hsp70 family protein [Gulosibacter sp.]|uniref:Hsp70 family protein n=1 Tax=Gulosibacter sp. TaxID=2817531 RepID=UPI003F8EA997